jgi:hypothetical protein
MTELAFRPPVADEDFDPLAPDDTAPLGYTIDRATGERRPKLKTGRPKLADAEPDPPRVEGDPPSLDELRAARQARRPAEDRAPQVPKGVRRAGKAPVDAPAFRAGPIAKGMNKLYLKGGKVVRVFDPEVGAAMIEATKKESEDDVTVGEAWEELARVNPRIRKFLLKLISGGAWGQLFMAHLPILLAVIMKPAVIKHVPFPQLIESLAEPEGDTAPGEGALPGGMTAADAEQMATMARQQMQRMGLQLSPEMSAQMSEMAQSMANGAAPGVHTIRQQPKRPAARSKRH